MSKTEKTINGAKSKVTTVSIYFMDDTDLFPAGISYAFHRRYGDREEIFFNAGSMASWLRLSRLINTSPGRLITAVNGLIWHPYEPDYFRLDGPRMRDTTLAILEEGDWQLSDPDLDWSSQWDFARRVVEAMRHPN